MLLALVLAWALVPVTLAVGEEAKGAADGLHELGLFQGTGTDAAGRPIYDLDRTPTRHEAVTMLVRLLGKETEARAGRWNTPFTDVADWARPYVGWAYAKGLTSGTGDVTFGGENPVSAAQYLTFVLRALGYSTQTDFKWDTAWELSDQLGVTVGEYGPRNNNDFLRGDMAKISLNALAAVQKDSAKTLADKLIAEGVFTQAQYRHAVSDGSGASQVSAELDAAISSVLRETYRSSDPDGLLHVQSYELLAREVLPAKAGTQDPLEAETVYLIVYAALYRVRETAEEFKGDLIPTSITFSIGKDSAYTLKEYWTPGAGTVAEGELRGKFPPAAVEAALHRERYAERLKEKNWQQVTQYLDRLKHGGA